MVSFKFIYWFTFSTEIFYLCLITIKFIQLNIAEIQIGPPALVLYVLLERLVFGPRMLRDMLNIYINIILIVNIDFDM